MATCMPGQEKDKESQELEVFVTGRLCILGEHSDWAAAHRTTNRDIEVGMTIVCATNEGLHAKCSRAKDSDGSVTFLSSLHASLRASFQDIHYLSTVASSDNPMCYVAGTLLALLQVPRYKQLLSEEGLFIDNYATTLPIKKGLSSSAACCVLVVKCFSAVYQLNICLEEVMDLAYRGERFTSSKCGRMDQCVAMGRDVIALMSFSGTEEGVTLQIVDCPRPLFFVVADLHASKDTIQILSKLQNCFPFPTGIIQENMHKYVNENRNVALQAVESISKGDYEGIAKAMRRAQENFDNYAMPVCPDQLTAPILHSMINDVELQMHCLAVKGVGSQGDGSVQFFCQSSAQQRFLLAKLLEKYNLDGLALTIPGAPS